MPVLPHRPHHRGVVAVELALVAIPLIMLMYAGLELGRAMYTYTELAQSTRAAARYLATCPTIGATEITRARALVRHGSFADTEDTLVPELVNSATIQVCSPSFCDVTGRTTESVTNVPVAGAGTTHLVVVQVSNLTLVSHFPQTVTDLLMRPITVTLPRV